MLVYGGVYIGSVDESLAVGLDGVAGDRQLVVVRCVHGEISSARRKDGFVVILIARCLGRRVVTCAVAEPGFVTTTSCAWIRHLMTVSTSAFRDYILALPYRGSH